MSTYRTDLYPDAFLYLRTPKNFNHCSAVQSTYYVKTNKEFHDLPSQILIRSPT